MNGFFKKHLRMRSSRGICLKVLDVEGKGVSHITKAGHKCYTGRQNLNSAFNMRQRRCLLDVVHLGGLLGGEPKVRIIALLGDAAKQLKAWWLAIFTLVTGDGPGGAKNEDKLAHATGCQPVASFRDEALGTRSFVFHLVAREQFRQSSNFALYKRILPQMRRRTFNSYQEMTRLNKLFERFKIKYVAVAGTLLGLVRHGGIVPWDNDIDIGFSPRQWRRLKRRRRQLARRGFPFKPVGKLKRGHAHLGLIDCFRMSNAGRFWRGRCGTICEKEAFRRARKQPFGPTYVRAPVDSHESLKKRYGAGYYEVGDVSDNFHFKSKKTPRFKITLHDMSYQVR